VGLICNIVNIFTLHSCGGGHSHHDHHHVDHEHVENPVRKLSHCHSPYMEEIMSRQASIKASRANSGADLCIGGKEQARVYKDDHENVVLSYNDDDDVSRKEALAATNTLHNKNMDSNNVKSSLNMSVMTDNNNASRF